MSDENLAKRISALESSLAATVRIQKQQIEIIARLELCVSSHEDYLKQIHTIALHDPEKTMAHLRELDNRLSNLERMRDTDYKIYSESIKHILGRKPHKCPVCDGEGTNILASSTCIACDDMGIVWG